MAQNNNEFSVTNVLKYSFAGFVNLTLYIGLPTALITSPMTETQATEMLVAFAAFSLLASIGAEIYSWKQRASAEDDEDLPSTQLTG